MEDVRYTDEPLTLETRTEQGRIPQTSSNNVLNQPFANNSSLKSAPPTPNPSAATPRRSQNAPTSPLQHDSPKVIRRASSAMSLNDRPASSPSSLRRQSSRPSIGTQYEGGDKRLTPKRSISNLISGLREAQTKMEAIEEPVPLTAAQIATEHFSRELAAHNTAEADAETVFILHDACYGHRYSRPKTTKTTLSLIVERPERVLASVLGASTAYVRLGGHHSGGRNAPHPANRGETKPPFKIRRTNRAMDITSSYVTNVHGTAWMSELRGMCDVAGEKLAAGARELSRSSTPTEPEKRKLHEGDLYLCSESLNAFQGALGGVADAVDSVFQPDSRAQRAFVAVRPPGHHCSADYPSGFCWINNVHVGIEYAAQTYGLTHAAILDFDLHHGDGSQAITWERNSKNNVKRQTVKHNSKLRFGPDIGYYSIHDINSYPCEMGDDEKVQAASLCIDNAHGQSIWNIHLQEWKTEREFWELYETKYRILLEKARLFLRHHTNRLKAEGKVTPKSAIFISAGFDASEWEGSGMQRHKVNVPTEFYARFTRDIVELASEEGIACDGRVISVLEGGYSDRALCTGTFSHLCGLCAIPVEAAKNEPAGMEALDQMMRGLGINGAAGGTDFTYNKAWWSPSNLTALEMQVNPPPPPQVKKTRVGQQPTYATPTESFAYKVVDADKFARSISGTMREVQQPARPPTPPLPEVDWVTATQELSKLLIPLDRQTKSCTPEELAGPKIKKEYGGLVTIAEPIKPRQLRDRKTRGPGYPDSTHSDETESLRSMSRSSRRQTIAELPSASTQPEPSHQRRASRRLSAGSALSSLADLDPNPPPVPQLTNGSSNTNATKPSAIPNRDLQLKKARAPPKKDISSNTPASPKRISKPPARLSSAANASAPSATGTSTTNNDLDTLTAGMKKVTLKVGTREDHDRKQKEKLDAERKARAVKAAETRKANAAAKKAAKEIPTSTSKVANGIVVPVAPNTGAPASSADPVAATYQQLQTVAPQQLPQHSFETQVTTVGPTSYHPPGEMYQLEHLQVQPQLHSLEGAPSIVSPDASSTMNYAGAAVYPPQSVNDTVNSTAAFNNAQPVIYNHLVKPPIDMDGFAPRPVLSSREGSRSAPRSPNGDRLPTWSSTGTIPFAAQNGSPLAAHQSQTISTGERKLDREEENLAESLNMNGQQRSSVWDVPVTPRG